MDETYERILKEIKRPNKHLAQRVLQCLFVAVRPLRVEELAGVLAVDFDDVEGIPRLKPDWRWEDQELALLSACSSLIAIVEAGDSRVVQFSHFSVKEFLTSPRLAIASGRVSNYFIDLEPAHRIMAQASLGILLKVQDGVDGSTRKDHPALYAAEHWATHAQFGGVASHLYNGMEYLFDADKPYFKVWLTLCDIDTRPSGNATFRLFAPIDKSPATPLYYAALCGFHDIVKHLISRNPQDVNANGGYCVRPLFAALAGDHFQTADLLRQKGPDKNIRGVLGRNPLHAAARSGKVEVVRRLIECDPADINATDFDGSSPLHFASSRPNLDYLSVIGLLLERGADVNARNGDGRTPLHFASFNGLLDVVRLLLKHGADIEAKDHDGGTPMQQAIAGGRGYDEVVELLGEYDPARPEENGRIEDIYDLAMVISFFFCGQNFPRGCVVHAFPALLPFLLLISSLSAEGEEYVPTYGDSIVIIIIIVLYILCACIYYTHHRYPLNP